MSDQKDIERVIAYLTHTYNKATAPLERAFRGKNIGPNMAYLMDTEMAYLINEIQRGPRSMVQTAIANCNEFLDQVIQEVDSWKKQKEAETSTD